jgi:hypothetical protein
MSYTRFRIVGISDASVPWTKRCSRVFWDITKGTIGKERSGVLRKHLSTRYADVYAQRKVLNFAKAFLKYLAKTHFDTRYQAFELFLELPKALKERKLVTEKIVLAEDVICVLATIQRDCEAGELNEPQRRNFTRLVLFGAFTGQRPYATIRKLTVGQFRRALAETPPVLEVLSEQDKIRMAHYCPFHPQVVDAVSPLVNTRRDEKAMFIHEAFDDG